MKKLLAIVMLIPFLLGSCASIQVAITPAVIQAAGFDCGYYGYAFTSIAPISQLAINAACALAPKAALDPAGTLTQLEALLQQSWTQAYSVLTNNTYGALIVGAAQLAIDEINALTGQLTSAASSSISDQYIMAAIDGICAGVAAAQGHSTPALTSAIVTQQTTWQKVKAWFRLHF